MENMLDHLKRQWKAYAIATWLAVVSGLLIYLNVQLHSLRETSLKLVSDVDSIEGILISTDSNVSQVKEQVDKTAAKVTLIQKRVRRR